MSWYFISISAAVCIAIWYQQTVKLQPVDPGSVVLITGASSGIGKHAALSLVKEGFTVFASVRKPTDGENLLASAARFGLDTSTLKPILLDVTDSESIQKAFETVSQFVGDRGLHGLFNNAGILLDSSAKSSAVEHQDLSTYRQTFDVNFFGMIEVTQSFLPLLRQRQGRIVMNSSIAGFFATPFLSAYCSSKHAIEGFSDSLRRELAPHGVSVSILQPHFITSSILKIKIPVNDKEAYREAESRHWQNFYKHSRLYAVPPKVTSTAVIHAMRAQRAQIRYFVGGTMAFMLYFVLRCFPDALLDFVLSYQPALQLTEQDKTSALEAAQVDFPL